jgi:hypothetical protein
MKWSPSTGGFYLLAVHGSAIPDDAVDISDELYAELRNGQHQKEIVAGPNGLPMLATPSVPNPRIAEIKSALLLIDSKKTRALTDAILTGDKTHLQAYEAQAEALRTELQGIEQ